MKIIWNQMDPYCDVILIRHFHEIIMMLSWQVIFIRNICDMAALVHLNHLVAIVLYKCITNTFECFFFFPLNYYGLVALALGLFFWFCFCFALKWSLLSDVLCRRMQEDWSSYAFRMMGLMSIWFGIGFYFCRAYQSCIWYFDFFFLTKVWQGNTICSLD